MSKLASRYAIVQFLPYAETGEFANVGVVLLCPEAGYFGYRLQTRRIRRVMAFFEHVGRKAYTRALDLFEQELARVAEGLAGTAFSRQDAEAARLTFERLVHPREAILRFGPQRALLADAPEAALAHLFGQYVEHEFATRDDQEGRMEREIGAMLRGLQLLEPFRALTLGNDELHARFPFVQGQPGAVKKVIKPFFLAQDEPNRIYEHADPWLQKLRRLRARNLLPPRVLLSLDGPPVTDVGRFQAYDEIRRDIQELGFEVVTARRWRRHRPFRSGLSSPARDTTAGIPCCVRRSFR